MRTPDDYDYEGAPDPLGMVDFIRYDPETGEILGVAQAPRISYDTLVDDPKANVLLGQAVYGQHHVDLETMAITARAPCPAVVDGTVIRNVPNPSTVTVRGETYEVTDGEIDLTESDPGSYDVRISSVKYVDLSLLVVVP